MKLNKHNFEKYLNNKFFFENNPKVAVAVSGGPDSMALADLVKNWVKLKKGDLIALIVNHQIRSNSIKEARHVKKTLIQNKINSKILTIRKNKVLKKSMNEARQNRFDIITNYCKKNNILHLFLGHHKDDNLETYLIRKISGSDIEGLECISPNIIKNNINIIRPFLNFKKKDIYEYNFEHKISFVEDPSNSNMLYTRPILRKYINNLNLKYYTEIENEFKNLNKNISLYRSMISEILINNIKFADKKKVAFDLDVFQKLDNLVKEKIIKKIYTLLFGSEFFLRSAKVQIMVDQINQKKFKILNLKSMLIKKDQNFLVFYPKVK